MTETVSGSDVITGPLANLLSDRLSSKSAAGYLQKYALGDWTTQDTPFGADSNFLRSNSYTPKTNYNFNNGDGGSKLYINYFSDGYNNNNGSINLTTQSLSRANAFDQFNITFKTNWNYSGGNGSDGNTINFNAKILGNTPDEDIYITKNNVESTSQSLVNGTQIATYSNQWYASYRSKDVNFSTSQTNYNNYDSKGWHISGSFSNYQNSVKNEGYSFSLSSFGITADRSGDFQNMGDWINVHVKLNNLNINSRDLSVVTNSYDATLNQEQMEYLNSTHPDLDVFDSQSPKLGFDVIFSHFAMYGNNIINIKNTDGYYVDAGDGNDKITGNIGDDSLFGGNGNDTLLGGAGDDSYILSMGSTGSDVITDTGGSYDTLMYTASYGTSNLTMFDMYSQGNNLYVQRMNISNTTSSLMATVSNNVGAGKIEYFKYHDDNHAGFDTDWAGNLIMASTSAVIAAGASSGTTTGTAENNLLVGTQSADTLIGGDGNDWLQGGGGDDLLTGGAGDEYLVGGAGTDTLVGGTGNDMYDINNKSGTQFTVATAITDTSVVETITDNRGENNSINLYLNTDQMVDVYKTTATTSVPSKLVISFLDATATFKTVTVVSDAASIQTINILQEDVWANTNELILLTLATDPTAGKETDDLVIGTTAAETLVGGDGKDVLLGADGADSLDGGNGDDVLTGGAGADTLVGGYGRDVYILNADTTGGTSSDTIVETEDGGRDGVISYLSTYTLVANIENFGLRGSALTGIGNELDNNIIGNSQNNTIDGGAGDDYMEGRSGNDTYTVDSAGDRVKESVNDGTDTVKSTISYTLGDNVERLTLQGILDIDGTGNDLNNVITGNDGNNVLDGGRGDDTLSGLGGNDIYYVDSSNDVVVETTGNDAVYSSAWRWTMALNIENLYLMGNNYGTGIGNSQANTITGDDSNNTLDGKGGADVMVGGDGSDTYFVDSTGDVVTEMNNEGTDTIKATLSSYSIKELINVENLSLMGTAAGNATGNLQGNMINGNANNNTLFGMEGNDWLYGLAGNDKLDGGIGADNMDGGVGNDTLLGGAGNDTLIGGLGTDVMTGGAGSDTFKVSAGAKATITDLGGTSTTPAGRDVLNVDAGGAVSATLGASWTADSNTYNNGKANLSITTVGLTVDLSAANGSKGFNVTISGIAPVTSALTVSETVIGSRFADTLTGADGQDVLSGGSGNDILNGGKGSDTLTGGDGNDIFVFDKGMTPAGTLSTSPGSFNVDTIIDFVSGQDQIQLSKAIFTKFDNANGGLGTGIGGLAQEDFLSGTATAGTAPGAADGSDKILYNNTDGSLWYDPDGNKANGSVAVKIAIVGVQTHPDLQFSDFQIIA